MSLLSLFAIPNTNFRLPLISLSPYLLVLFLAACVVDQPHQISRTDQTDGQGERADVPTNRDGTDGTDEIDGTDGTDGLSALWLARSKDKGSDFPIGPGDELQISVVGMPELESRKERVDSNGKISLPYAAELKAGGLTEKELEKALRERLEEVMYNPRVSVYVREYQSRQVAVLGAVAEPGIYTLKGESDTLFGLINRAGGMATNADPLIQLIPAEPVGEGEAREAMEVAAALPVSLLQKDPSPTILKRSEPILIDLRELTAKGRQQYLYLPVRPGDVIMVPGGGQVLVEGWVEKPGAYEVTPELTVSGVVAAAGGMLYPADTGAVRLIRPKKSGKKTMVEVDLEKIKSGEMEDIKVQGGDIVEVPAANGKLVSYGMYKFFTTIVNVGVGASIIPR